MQTRMSKFIFQLIASAGLIGLMSISVVAIGASDSTVIPVGSSPKTARDQTMVILPGSATEVVASHGGVTNCPTPAGGDSYIVTGIGEESNSVLVLGQTPPRSSYTNQNYSYIPRCTAVSSDAWGNFSCANSAVDQWAINYSTPDTVTMQCTPFQLQWKNT